MKMKVKMSEKVLPAFNTFWRQCNRKQRRKLYKVLKGGRNSSKSTHIAIRIVWDVMRNPVNALAVRKVAATLETSVFEQLQWAIEYLGVSRYWKINKSPLKLTYLPRGNSILFRGADKPEKIKSIKTSKFPIAILWMEELAEFKTEDEVSTIVNSIVRADLPEGLYYDIYYSYNPPKRKQSWVNKKFDTQFLPANVWVHKSTYFDNPYVSKEFKEEAEEVKRKNEFKYRWEYLGESIGSGVVPFTNLTFRRITDDEIKRFDNIKQGIDWGYAADPFSFGRMHLDKTRRKLYLFGEIYGVKLSNRHVAEQIKKNGWHTTMTIADSAEPKSVDEMKGYGVRIKGAEKGPGSVEYGEKWLDDLDEIIIDPYRCPNTAREFENIDYQTDKDGNIKSKLEDKDNHSIDMTRCACEDDMRTERSWKGVSS
jgi:PBSX family phage terminase large subunit